MQTLQWTTYVGIAHEPQPLKIDAGSLDHLAVDMLRRMGCRQIEGVWSHPDNDAQELDANPWLALSELRSQSVVSKFADDLRQMQERISRDYYLRRCEDNH